MQDPAPASIGERVRLRRLGAELSQQQLATKAGMATRTLQRVELGDNVRVDKLMALADALDVPLADLIGEPVNGAS